MAIQIELTPDLEAQLAAQAGKNGIPIGRYVQRILEQHVPSRTVKAAMTPGDRAKAFQDWVQTFPYHRTEPLAEDAISRESFYRQDDE